MAYTLGIYLLNLFLAFLQPKFDPSLTQDEGLEDGEGASTLPTKQDDEFRPFVRRLPEFKFWHAATRATLIAFFCTFFDFFDIPVFWPVLVMYWLILFVLTSMFPVFCHISGPGQRTLTNCDSATADSTYDQVPLRSVFDRQGPIRALVRREPNQWATVPLYFHLFLNDKPFFFFFFPATLGTDTSPFSNAVTYIFFWNPAGFLNLLLPC